MVVGVADPAVAPKMIGVLRHHGASRVLVVHGDDGLDELTTTAPSTVWELRDGEIDVWRLDPTALGLPPAGPEALRGGDPSVNAGLARAVLAGERGPHRDIVTLNAAAGLVVGDAVTSLEDGLVLAGEVLDDGRAADALERLVAVSAES
jgi:anthranilate phosphoribosyltransferase